MSTTLESNAPSLKVILPLAYKQREKQLQPSETSNHINR